MVQMSKLRYIVPVVALLAIVALAGTTRPAFAAGVVGTGTPASCTFQAFDAALQGGGSVTFNCGPNPVTIGMQFIETISANTNINGGGKITLTAAPSGNHFQVFSGKTFTISNITLSGGNSSPAGAIENFGTTNATGVTFSGNTSPSNGGAITNYGTLTVVGSVFKSNTGANGGAIFNDGGGAVTITSSTFKKNSNTASNGGGAIDNESGSVSVSGSTFAKNTSATNAGAILNDDSTTITGSTFNKNTSSNGGGAIMNLNHNMTISTSTIKSNTALYGGGVVSYGSTFNVTQSTFSGNTSTSDGGGLYISGTAVLTNDTLSGNTVTNSAHGGGGLYQHYGTVLLQFVTVANNTTPSFGGGIYKDGSVSGTMTLVDTVLSNNHVGNCDGAGFVSLGHNLSSDSNCGSFLTNTGDKNSKNAKLGALANNGGPTQTLLPLAGSPLINKGAAAGGVTVDQRNLSRPFGGKYDIGAVEVH